MPRHTTHLDRKYADIKKEYKRLSAKKTASGARIYTYDYMLDKLSDKFYLSSSQIQRILTKKE